MTPPTDEIEASLLRIPDVRAARLVTGEDGTPVEVHVVAGGAKSAKQIVRDVQTVAMATFGLDIDHRIVSVVQFPDGKVAEPQVRIVIEEVATSTREAQTTVRVALKRDGRSDEGEASGASNSDALVQSAAAATLVAVHSLLPPGFKVALEHASVTNAAGAGVALIALTLQTPAGSTRLTGSAPVTGQEVSAVARAVLSALNRRLR